LAADVGLGVTRLPEASPVWSQALRQAGVPFSNPNADAALVWGLQNSGVGLETWGTGPENQQAWLAQARVRLADQVKLQAELAQTAAQSLPDQGASRAELYAARDDLRYLVEAYGPNVPTATARLEKLYRAAESAANNGRAAALKASALSIADSLLQGLPKPEDSVRAEGGGASKAIALAKPEKKWTFEERARAIKQALAAKVSTSPKSKSLVDPRRETIDGIQAELIDEDGRSNAGVYRYYREGRRRVMKITRHEDFAAYPEEGIEHAIDAQVQGGVIGSFFGAPKLLRTGIADLGYHRYYFVEMEELFPGQKPRSFKSAAAERDSKFIAMLGRPRADGLVPAREMADKLVEVLEYGVVPYDGDFLVTPDGRLSWIDTNWWTVDENAGFPKEKVKVMREAYYFLARLAADREAGRAFAEEFLSRLRESKRIGAEIKEDILKDWTGNDPELLKKLGLPTDPATLRAL
jgi:hypothetical protein